MLFPPHEKLLKAQRQSNQTIDIQSIIWVFICFIYELLLQLKTCISRAWAENPPISPMQLLSLLLRG